MARRRRLTPPQSDFLDQPTAPPAPAPGPLSAPPIAQVAGEAATSAALEALSEEMARARAQGRLLENLPLEAVDAAYLVRDRIGVAPEEQTALVESLRARGQQTAIEVVDLGADRPGPRYGLISGWRRLKALRQLHEETGEARFAEIRARVTRPGETSEAYLAMVEENEIRVGLSHYERARIAVRAVEEGVFAHDRAALDTLYASASRARKSKIRSFVALVRQLDGALSFPVAIGERLGLDLARRLGEEPGFAKRVARALKAAAPADAEAEQAALKKMLRPGPVAAPPAPSAEAADAPADSATAARRGSPAPQAGAGGAEPGGIALSWDEDAKELRLSGPGVTPAFRQALENWLSNRSS